MRKLISPNHKPLISKHGALRLITMNISYMNKINILGIRYVINVNKITIFNWEIIINGMEIVAKEIYVRELCLYQRYISLTRTCYIKHGTVHK